MKENSLMKGMNIFFILLFVGSAALQYNDPDPIKWMLIYLLGAFICWQALRGKEMKWFSIVCIVVYAVYAVYLFIEENGVLAWYRLHNSENLVQSMKATKPWIEETREFLGLLILIFALIVNLIFFSNVQKRNRRYS